MNNGVYIKNGNRVVATIDKNTYNHIVDNFFFNKQTELKNNSVTLKNLREISRSNGFLFSLFFAKPEQIESLTAIRNKQIFAALDGKHIVGTRGPSIDIRAIAPIIQDFIAKQKLYNKYGNTIRLNGIVKYLSSSQLSVEQQALYIIDKLSIDVTELRSKNSKSEAFKYLRDTLSKNHIHVYVEARNCMPINVPDNLSLSGFYLRSNTNPCIFIANEVSGHPEEGAARKIYTTLFLVSCIFKNISYAISIDKKSYQCNYAKFSQHKIYDIVNEILLPSNEMNTINITSYADLEIYSASYKISVSALLNRLWYAKLLGRDEYRSYRRENSQRFEEYVSQNRRKNKENNNSGPPPKVLSPYYQGDFVNFLKTKVPITEREALFKKHVSYSRLNLSMSDFK